MVDERADPLTQLSESAEPVKSSGHDDTIPASSPPGSVPPEAAASIGERYRLGAELGRGGMGRVVEAFDTQLGRTVALKEVLAKSAVGIERRFRREVEITARLEHASIVPLYDSGTMPDGRPFYVMRRVSGRPLDELIARARGLPDRLALLPNVLAAIDAVAHAHRRGVIHRDLKPANILVGDLGETVVIDWGLAKVRGEPDDSLEPRVPTAADSLQTQVGSVFGTPGFMPPEQARGDELGPPSDVFALGATLYHLLVGRPPLHGTSATEVLESTLQHSIVPVATACPGAPLELVAIVDKALRFEAAERYPHAGALGEDVRRFLTGQLVAAHSYTRRQRLARFARRHRAALSVAALASVAVATLAWIGVHRIVEERDLATVARREADQRRAQAEGQRAELARRADQLLLLRARALLESNPTETIAVLKGLSAGSPGVDEAKAIAKAAVVRGVAWGLPSLPGLTVAFALSHDGRRLLQTDRDGKLQIVDLDVRRVIATHALGGAMQAAWVADDQQVLLAPSHHAPVLYDPVANRETIVDAPAFRATSVTSVGDQVAYVDENDQVGVLDLQKRAATRVWTGHAGGEVVVASDGSWLAFEDRSDRAHARLVVTDRAGHELLHRDGRVGTLARSAGGKLAVLLDGRILEMRPGHDTASVEVPVDQTQTRVMNLVYRGENLELFALDVILTWDGQRVWRSTTYRDGVLYGFEAGDGAMVVNGGDGKVHVVRGDVHAELAQPGASDHVVRLAARAGVSRFATTCGISLCVWELDDVLPKQLPGTDSGYFLDSHRVLITNGLPTDWSVLDIDTGKQQRLSLGAIGLAESIAMADDGRVLAVIENGQPTTSVLVLGPDLKQRTLLEGVSGRLARLVPGDGVVVASGRGRIIGQIGRAEPRELVRLDGDVIGVFENGHLGYTALSNKGELVRGRFDGQGFERIQVAIEPGAFVLSDHRERVHVASGNRLLRWDAGLHEVASFAQPIDVVSSTASGLVVTLADHNLYFVPDDGPPRRIPLSGGAPMTADGGQQLVGIGTGGQVELVALPSLAVWTLPRDYTALPWLTVSPDGRRILQQVGRTLVLWDLPRSATDYAAWLEELTNGEEVDGALTWPWQNPGGGRAP